MSKPKNIYLVAQYVMKPKEHVNTSRKGWMDNPDNIRYDEQVSIVRGLRTKDQNAQVVLNLSTKTIERNRFNASTQFDEIFRYFLENYTQYIAQTMSLLDPEYLATIANSMEAEMQSAQEATAVSTIQEAVINEEVPAQ
jgi:hypothetical protein